MTDLVQATFVQFYSNLEKLRVAEKFTDLTIECGDLHFKCHRVVLASASPFFDSNILNTATYKEREREYCLSIEGDVSALTLESVLVFIYTGDVTVTNVNICDLFKASKIFGLTGIADRCLEFIKKNKMTVDATVSMYSIACQDKNETLIDILSQDIADQLRVFVRSDSFLEISFNDFKVVLDKFVSSSAENEEALLAAIYTWTWYCQEKRFIYFGQLCKMIRHRSLSTEIFEFIINTFSKIMSNQHVELALEYEGEINSNFTAMPRTTVVSSALATKKLYFFIKYAKKTPVKIFSVDENDECESSGEFHLKGDSFWIQTIAVKDHLYSLEYVRRNPGGFHDQQSFCVHNSIKMNQSLKLDTPPIVFGDIQFGKGRNNNIYAYNSTPFQPIVRTLSQCSAAFDDEEINRGIYLYNADLDVWLPVPAMKRRVEDACLTTYDGSLYLIGGISDSDNSPSAKLVQTYDCREGKWHVLPQSTHNDHIGANCCEYDGKIYVCGGRDQPTEVERYDPRSGEWEILKRKIHGVQYHHLVSYNHRLWSLGNFIPNYAKSSAVPDFIIQSYPDELTLKDVKSKTVELSAAISQVYGCNPAVHAALDKSHIFNDAWEKKWSILLGLRHSGSGVILDGIVF